MFEFDPEKPVMITGATGYVAGWIVKELLGKGLTVHAPVRDPSNPKKVGHLEAMAKEAPGTLKLFRADLLEEGSYAESAEGCQLIFHTASPFFTDVKDPQKELIDPALLGTRNVLAEANRVESVGRVVLTSSVAAIYSDNSDVAKAPGGVLTEEVWNTGSSLEHQPYNYSKTLAEREAWKIAEAQDRWQLVVINPSLVIGPGTTPKATSESFQIVRQMGDGTLRFGAPRWGMGVVDVRDLAKAHLEAGLRSEAQGRHIVSAHDTDIFEMAYCLREKFGDRFPLPHFTSPKLLVWMFGPWINPAMTREAVQKNVDVPFRADSSKAQRELGIEFRPMQESMEDMFEQMVEAGEFS